MLLRSRLVSTASLLASVAAAFLAACGDATAPVNTPSPAVAAFSGSANSGGVNGGGANAGGVNAGGGGGGGGGVSAPASGSCASITSFSNSDGYYRIWAAIWTKYSFANNCGGPVTVSFTYTNGLTGNVDFSASAYVNNGTIDEDWADFSTPYTVTMKITDAFGNVLDSRSAVVTTKVGKSGTGA